jgi:hypothetical protein
MSVPVTTDSLVGLVADIAALNGNTGATVFYETTGMPPSVYKRILNSQAYKDEVKRRADLAAKVRTIVIDSEV